MGMDASSRCSSHYHTMASSLSGGSRKVCVIGAAAGLLAAAGFEVTVLEARDRVGGRIHQTPRLGLPIDIGASWIHGTRGNPLVALAEKAGATTVACGAVDSICGTNGEWLSRDLARHRYEEVWEILEMAMDHSRKKSAWLSDHLKMMDFFPFMGDDCENQSLKNIWLDAGLERDNLYVASTFGDILTGLLSPVADKATLRLNCEVTRIANSQVGLVDIEAADGFRDSFGSVIVTAPLGWLKRNEDVFSPPLPWRVSTAIRSLGYGNLDKVFIKFPRAFWDKRDSGANSHRAEGTGSRPFSIESLFLCPAYSDAADTNPAKWRQEIISFSGLPEPFSQPVIMFFVYGQWGRHITGLVRGMKQDSQEYYRILNDNFQPYYSKLPNYDMTSSDCVPSKFLSTDWQNDKFAGYGSFTNQPVGSGTCSKHFRALREGMGEDRWIWFAGEHTSRPGGLGTVTGAYWSGEQVAKRVARRCGLTIDAQKPV
ncbi:hypothetical protein QBC46DRAFT_459890 [Diplogelasinospora grovesii]|uniref:Amine oxidase domain-containing protein n=1 Tax=Diplogelasinospora grovesii TaxID=303347 RepID=A0AAN6S3B3_9PEZI|nr:hypothetical protein QBC46DRAFT_459890 [Diplogelasinospora grovesii]